MLMVIDNTLTTTQYSETCFLSPVHTATTTHDATATTHRVGCGRGGVAGSTTRVPSCRKPSARLNMFNRSRMKSVVVSGLANQ